MSDISDWRIVPEFFLERVFRLLSWRDRYRCSLVCQSWAAVFYSPSLWRDLCLLPDDDTQEALLKEEEMFISRRGSVSLLQSRLDYDHLSHKTDLCLRAIGPYIHRLYIPATDNYYLLHRCMTTLSNYLEFVLEQDIMLQLDTFIFDFHSEWNSEHPYGTGGPLLSTLQTVVQRLILCTAYTLQHIRISCLLLSLPDAQRLMRKIFLTTLEQACQQRRDSIQLSSDCELIGYYPSDAGKERRPVSPTSSTSSDMQDEEFNAYTIAGLSENGPPCIGFSNRNNCGPLLFIGLANLTQCIYRPDGLFQLPAVWADRLHTLELSPQNISGFFLQQLLMNTACQVLLVSQDEYSVTSVEPWTEIDPLVWHSLLMLRPQFRVYLRLHLMNADRQDIIVQFLDMSFPNSVAPVRHICYENSPLPLDLSRALSLSAYSVYLTTLVFHTLPNDAQTDDFCDDALQMLFSSCPLLCELYLSTPICPDTLWALVHIWRQPQLFSTLPQSASSPLLIQSGAHANFIHTPEVRQSNSLNSSLNSLVVSRSCVREGIMHWAVRDLMLGSHFHSDDETLLVNSIQTACVSLDTLEMDIKKCFCDPSWHFRSDEEFRRSSFLQ